MIEILNDFDVMVLDLVYLKKQMVLNYLFIYKYIVRFEILPADKLCGIELVCVGVIKPLSFSLIFFSYFFRFENNRNEFINDRDFRGLLGRVTLSGVVRDP